MLLEDECLDDKSTGWLTIVLLLTLDVADDGDGDEGSFLMPKDEFVCDWIWEAATIFLKFDNELFIKGFDGDEDSEEDFGDSGNPDDGENGFLLFPKVGLNILSIENGKTLCNGFRKFAWFWSWGGKKGFGEADNVWFRFMLRKGWNNKGNPVVELNVEGELKGEFVVVHAECGDNAMEDAGEWLDPLDEHVLGVAGGEFTGDPYWWGSGLSVTRISGLGQLSGADKRDNSSSSAFLFDGAGLAGTTSTTLLSTSMFIMFLSISFRALIIFYDCIMKLLHSNFG